MRRAQLIPLVIVVAVALVGCSSSATGSDASRSPSPSATASPSAQPTQDTAEPAAATPDPVPASIAALQPARVEPFSDPSASSLGTPSSIVSTPGRWPIATLEDAAAVLASDDHQALRVMLRTIRFLC